jgi:hypothetical protein
MSRPTTPIVWHLCRNVDCAITALYDWQTLVGSLIALGAAIWAGRLVLKQLRLSEVQETTRRQQRFTAARSTLPLTLSAMTNYAVDMAQRLKTFKFAVERDHLHGLLLEPVSPPSDAIAALERMIEATDDLNVTKMLRKMLSEIQLLQSRSAELGRVNLGERVGIPHNVDVYILQCATIYAQASALFNFARFANDDVTEAVTWAGAYNALSVMGIRDMEFPALYEFCRKVQANGNGPESP